MVMIMGVSCTFKELALLVVKLTIVATSVAAQAKPGDCLSNCGNISIPYPFGTGGNCNMSSNFFISCDNTSNPPKAFLTTLPKDSEVLNISLDGYLRISSPVGYDCYNSSGRDANFSFDMWIQLSKFSLSHARNKFIAIGCDTYAFIQGGVEQNFSTGCLTSCRNNSDVIGGYCSGIGCCQAAIPKVKGVSRYNISFSSDHNHSQVLEFNPCSYGFVVESGAYNFSVSDLKAKDFRNKQFPIIVNWTIGNQTCQDAKKDREHYACKQNSSCVDPGNGLVGYLCKCLDGFEGNPYLSDFRGCKDIDECTETLNPCTTTCHNSPGSYNCSCPKGFQGDGLKNGIGCIRTFRSQILQLRIG
ncbi:hypothetical protein DITRI_Ditri05aG0162300 [Diplodiscus trichospermus]